MKETVLVVDDHAGFRACARKVLEADGFEVVGEAANASSAIDAARTLRPAVVVLDVRLPDLSGMQAARLISSKAGPAVVLTSSHDLGDLGGDHALAESGAAGFVPKADLSGDVLRALLG